MAVHADLKKFLKKNADGNTLGVADSKLGSIIREKLGIPCIYRSVRTLHVDDGELMFFTSTTSMWHSNPTLGSSRAARVFRSSQEVFAISSQGS